MGIINQEMVTMLFTVVVIPILGIMTKYVCALITTKINEIKERTGAQKESATVDLLDKYLLMAEEALIKAVVATNQTYVDSLKAQGKFDLDAQKVAYEKTKNAFLTMLDSSAKEILSNSLLDFDQWIDATLEYNINVIKR